MLVTHVVPNALGPVIVQASVLSAFALQLEAGLSFLGLGTQPPTPSLGGMLSDGRDVLIQAPWVEIFPGLAIVFAVLGLHLPRRRAAPGIRPEGSGGMSPVLSFASVGVRFGRDAAPGVDNVSLEVQPGRDLRHRGRKR